MHNLRNTFYAELFITVNPPTNNPSLAPHICKKKLQEALSSNKHRIVIDRYTKDGGPGVV